MLRRRIRSHNPNVANAGDAPPPTANVAVGPNFGNPNQGSGATNQVRAALGTTLSMAMNIADRAAKTALTTSYKVTFLGVGTNSITAPKFTTSAKLKCWGGGASGSGNNLLAGGGGGGGGAYSETTALSVTGGTTVLSISVADTKANGTGNDTWISNTGSAPTSVSEGCLAKGGGPAGSPSNTTQGAGGTGGSTASSVGDNKFAGGNGGGSGANQINGGGGGGGAGDTQAGSAGVAARTGGAGGTADGGAGGTGGSGINAGTAGSSYGGGGAGASSNASSVHGAGAQGKVEIIFS